MKALYQARQCEANAESQRMLLQEWENKVVKSQAIQILVIADIGLFVRFNV